jgi:hypothetical protein
MLNRILNAIPPDLVYRFLDTSIGQRLYSIGFSLTRTRRMRCGETAFRMQTPSSKVFLWDDYPVNGCHEPLTTRAFVEALSGSESDVVWDIGSKCGYFMMLATQFVPPENVHVFEPEPPHLRVIEENNEQWLNDGAKVNGVYVSDTPGNGSITGDEYANRNGYPDLVKVDVDGPEVDVLRGMERSIAESTPMLLIELHVDDGWKPKVDALVEVLAGVDYEYAVATEHRKIDEQWKSIAELNELSTQTFASQDMLLQCVPKDNISRDYE